MMTSNSDGFPRAGGNFSLRAPPSDMQCRSPTSVWRAHIFFYATSSPGECLELMCECLACRLFFFERRCVSASVFAWSSFAYRIAAITKMVMHGASARQHIEISRVTVRGEKAVSGRGGRVFEVLDTIDFGSSADVVAKVVGRNGLRMGPALARMFGSIKEDGSRKRMSESGISAQREEGVVSLAAVNDDLVGILQSQPDVAAIVSRANAAARPIRGNMVRARRNLS